MIHLNKARTDNGFMERMQEVSGMTLSQIRADVGAYEVKCIAEKVSAINCTPSETQIANAAMACRDFFHSSGSPLAAEHSRLLIDGMTVFLNELDAQLSSGCE